MTATRVGDPSRIDRQRGQWLTTASFGMVILLLAQYVLGISYNLYGTAPTPAEKVDPFSSPLLATHVVVGTLLIVVAVYLVAVSIRARARVAAAASVIGLASIVAAWISGFAFAAKGADGYSMTMGALTAVALLCYSTVVFRRRDHRQQ